MIYVGLDLSLTCTGVCVVDDKLQVVRLGADPLLYPIQPKAELRDAARLAWYREQFRNLLLRLTAHFPQQPVKVALEDYAYAASGNVAHLGELGGVVKLTALDILKEVPLTFSPGVIKKFTAGSGNAPKSVMVTEVLKRWKQDTTAWGKAAEDVADACAVAYLLAHYDLWKQGQYEPRNAKEREVFGAKAAPKKKVKRNSAPRGATLKGILDDLPTPDE